MDVIGLLPRLRFIRFPAGHVYLWHDPAGLTLIDTGLPGSAPLIRRRDPPERVPASRPAAGGADPLSP